MIEPYDPLYNNMLCRAGTGIADSKPNKPFHILFANFCQHFIDLVPRQVVVYASLLPETIFESDISHSEMIGVIPEHIDTKYCKRHVEARDIYIINKHLSEQLERHMGQDENPVTVDDIQLDVAHEKKEEIPNMFLKH